VCPYCGEVVYSSSPFTCATHSRVYAQGYDHPEVVGRPPLPHCGFPCARSLYTYGEYPTLLPVVCTFCHNQGCLWRCLHDGHTLYTFVMVCLLLSQSYHHIHSHFLGFHRMFLHTGFGICYNSNRQTTGAHAEPGGASKQRQQPALRRTLATKRRARHMG
jgi:hypothetical protein